MLHQPNAEMMVEGEQSHRKENNKFSLIGRNSAIQASTKSKVL